MDLLRAMEMFVQVVEREGFAPAARKLGVSTPAVTKAPAAELVAEQVAKPNA